MAVRGSSWAGPTGATTSTTLPGPAPNQSQINATQSQVAQIEGTLAEEEQQTSVLDDKYNTAVQNVQNAQSSLQTIATNLVHEKGAVELDKRLVSDDAIQAYVYGTPETGFASYFSSSATQNQARNQYTNAIVGNLTKDELALQHSEGQLQAEQVQQQTVAAQAQAEAAQAKSLAQANEAEAATTRSTLNQVQGQLAQEVAQAAIAEAQQEAAAAAAPRAQPHSNRPRPRRRRRRRSPARSVDPPAARRPPMRRTRRPGVAGLSAARRRAGPAGWPPSRRRSRNSASPMSSAARARGRLRLLGARPMGVGPGRGVHPPDDRDAVAGAAPRVARRPPTR